jgi:succinate dehydrogenase / fumarate reductase flavoprotein subunit
MEDRFGEKGNLMPRDVVSRCMYECPSQVYLDISFLGEKLIKERLGEIYKLCLEYLGLDVTKESIPVAPGVHFFMGGLRTDDDHMTDIDGLYAVGEGASKYHGANRLGGNSLLAAMYSGRVAARSCMQRSEAPEKSFGDVSADILGDIRTGGDGPGPSQILSRLAGIMNTRLGIVRDEAGLRAGLDELDALSKEAENCSYDEGLSAYENYRIPYMLITARAIMMSALAREESRGAHFRSDFPDTRDEYCRCSLTSCSGGELSISFEDDRIRGDRQ